MTMAAKLFGTDKRIRLGIWGLGRGQNFIESCRALNIDVVAGCDYNQFMRQDFLKHCPDALVTDDEEAFLNSDCDAVVIATYFVDHAKHTLKALRAGKHVLCEVTAFFTPAEAVSVVEAVEASGLVYNLAENYPFTKEHMYLKKLWAEGFFGDFVYGEFSYLHNCLPLSYAYNYPDIPPVEPGDQAHSWRSWLDFHYYCTHSLGPAMLITDARPEQVAAFPVTPHLPGFLGDGKMGTAAPSMIKMSNGGVLRNLMGALTQDDYSSRLWGTRAGVTTRRHGSNDKICEVSIGGNGHAEKLQVEPQWPELGNFAETAGHGGGDFWELYYFARQIHTGEKAPWNIYAACDVTMCGIMAIKSHQNQGKVFAVPDFRDKTLREAFRNDHFQQNHFDPSALFPKNADKKLTGEFSSLMRRLSIAEQESTVVAVRRALDGMRLYPELSNASDKFKVVEFVRELLNKLDEIIPIYRRAKTLAESCPDSLPGDAINALLKEGEIERLMATEHFRTELTNWLNHS